MAIVLIVSITPDRFVNKGPGRPVFEELMRAEMLAAMSSVDWVVINDEPTAEAMIETVKPQAYVKGPDYVRAEDDVSGKINVERGFGRTSTGAKSSSPTTSPFLPPN